MGDKIAKLRRAYPRGNVKSNCNFSPHNGERKEITCHTLNVMLLCTRVIVCLFSLPVLSFLSNVCIICTSSKMTCARFHSHVMSFLSPLWETKLQLDFTLPQGSARLNFAINVIVIMTWAVGSGQNSYCVRELDNPALHSLLLPCRLVRENQRLGC